MSAVFVLLLALVSLPTIMGQDFLVYSDTAYTVGSHISAIGKTYTTASAASFKTMTVADFQKYRAIVFADPNCSGSPSVLPNTNLDNLYKAVNGNVMVIGTDELFHGQGKQLQRSGLAFVAAEAGKTGLYVSLSCYYHGVAPMTVPFLAPLTSAGVSFRVTGVGCFNSAHIVASSPAINGLTDAVLSNWSCSVHEAFSTYPPEFVPLVIASGASGDGVQSFADGTRGIPYIVVRGASVSPINCGDGRVSAPEQCDSGPGCEKCKCAAGYEPNSPPTANCKMINYCISPGTSGKPANVLSCVPMPGARNITCEAGFYPSLHSSGGDIPWVVLKGTTAFGGCQLHNGCTAYGFSGKPENTDRCEALVNARRIYCKPGYRAAGGATSTSIDVTLTGSAAFGGCTLIDNCKEYGFSGKDANVRSCINGVNTRTIACNAGYYAVAPSNPIVTLTGSQAFTGCFQIDNCKVYGFNNDPNVVSCENLVNKRKITCKAGYWAQGRSNNGDTTNATQYAGAIGWIILEDNTVFHGCSPICGNGKVDASLGEKCDGGVFCRQCACMPGYEVTAPISRDCKQSDFCKLFGWSNDTNVEGCKNGINERTITCKPGYWAQSTVTPINNTQYSTAKPSITLSGQGTVFAGCKLIDTCAFYGFTSDPNVLGCTSSINSRTVICKPGYYAQSSVNNGTQYLNGVSSVTITGSATFLGCRENDNCRLYGYNQDPNVRFCSTALNQRTITCDAGYIVRNGGQGTGTSSVTLIGNTPFPGCTPDCGDKRVLGGEQCDDGNKVDGDGCSSICTVEEGWNCGPVSGPSSNAGYACCQAMDVGLVNYGLQDALQCWNSFWVSAIPGTSRIVFDSDVMYEMVANTDLKLCGHLIIGGIHRSDLELSDPEREHSMLFSGPVEVYGSVTVMGGGSIWFDPAQNSSLTIWPNCYSLSGVAVDAVDEERFDHDGAQFTMLPGSGLGVEGVDWDLDSMLSYPPLVRLMGGCSEIDGDLYFQAENIPTKSNAFPLIYTLETDDELCLHDFETITYDLPGSSCSNLETVISSGEVENAASDGHVTMYGITNYKHLCNWHIGLISAGVFVAAAGAAAVGAAALGGVGFAAQPTEYVAL